MEYLKLNNDVEMPIEGLGTFLMTPTEAEPAATRRACGWLRTHRHRQRLHE